MFLSDLIDEFDGSLAPGGTYVTNDGTYWSIHDVCGHNDIEKIVYGDYDFPAEVPSHIVVTAKNSDTGTLHVEQTEGGTAQASTPRSVNTFDLKSGTQVAESIVVECGYFRVRTENGGTGSTHVHQTVRLKDTR